MPSTHEPNDHPFTAEVLAELMKHAADALRLGDGRRGAELIEAAVEGAAAAAGRSSELYADALHAKAQVLLGVEDWAGAAEACREAVEVPAATREAHQDRLSYLLNLGELLTRAERYADAERELRRGLGAREEFYGAAHPGYAFGLTALADNLLAQDRAGEAEPLIDRAVEITAAADHDVLARDLSIRAFVVKAARGPDAEAFGHWPALSPGRRAQVVACCLNRSERAGPPVTQAVLLELRTRLRATPGADPTSVANVNALLVDAARSTGDLEVRLEACRTAVDLTSTLGRPDAVINAWEALALALDDAGRQAECDAAYAQALDRARATGARSLTAMVLRNRAIWLDSQGRTADSLATHRQAVTQAALGDDPVVHGRALAASGTFLLHHGEASARAELVRALEVLPPSHPDVYCAQSHLLAAEDGQVCSCEGGSDDAAVSRVVEQMVRARTGDLLASLRVTTGAEPEIAVTLARQPVDDELEHLEHAVHAALASAGGTAG